MYLRGEGGEMVSPREEMVMSTTKRFSSHMLTSDQSEKDMGSPN